MGTQETLTSNNQEAEMRSEAQRLSTFQFWPHNDKVEARKIAKAGFFHTGNDSEVKCPWCETVLTNWNYGDQVMARHRSANPQCPFIKNESDNVPLINNQPNVNTSQSESEDNEGKVDTFSVKRHENLRVVVPNVAILEIAIVQEYATFTWVLRKEDYQSLNDFQEMAVQGVKNRKIFAPKISRCCPFFENVKCINFS